MKRKIVLRNGVLADRKFYRPMLTLAIPVIIQNFIGSFLNMVDTVMVGRLGETAIAAVGIANQYFFIFMMFLIGLSAGCAVFIAQFGEEGPEEYPADSESAWFRPFWSLLYL